MEWAIFAAVWLFCGAMGFGAMKDKTFNTGGELLATVALCLTGGVVSLGFSLGAMIGRGRP